MSFIVVQYFVFFVLLVLLAVVVGNGIYKVMAGEKCYSRGSLHR